MKRKYLDEINVPIEERPEGLCINDERQNIWNKQKEEYGFDEREIWNLNYNLALILYERLRMFQNIATKYIDTEIHIIEYKEKSMTQKESIERIIEILKKYIKDDNDNPILDEEILEAYTLLGLIIPILWY